MRKADVLAGQWALLFGGEDVTQAHDRYLLRDGQVFREEGCAPIGSYSLDGTGIVRVRLAEAETSRWTAYEREMVLRTLRDWTMPGEPEADYPPITADTFAFNAEVHGHPRPIYEPGAWQLSNGKDVADEGRADPVRYRSFVRVPWPA